MRTSANRFGFTLAEIIIVILILAVAAAVVIPRATGMSEMQVQSAAGELCSDLEYAQSVAVSTQQPVTVSFSTTGNCYSMSNQSGVLIHPITKKSFVTTYGTGAYGDVRINAADFHGAATVTFDSLGAPDQDGSVTLLAGSQRYQIAVAPVTGRVSVAALP